MPALLICLLAFVSEQRGYLASLNGLLLDWRMAFAAKETSGEVAYVAIDSESLNAIGVWPWPRSVHAQLLDELTAAGVADVFFDIDFAFPTYPAEDRAFADALDRAGGATYLPVFAQHQNAANGAPAETRYNTPLDQFAQRSWPVLVNVYSGDDGLVRQYPFGATVDGEFIPSAAALLTGRFGDEAGVFAINYALRPETVPTYSAADLLGGRVPASELRGRSVIVGAHALELRDSFAVPVHRLIPGAVIHALAAETLLGGMEPRWLRAELPAALLLLILAMLQLSSRGRNPWLLLGVVGSSLVVAEAAALALFSVWHIVVPSGMLFPALLGFGLWRLAMSLDLSALRLHHNEIQAGNTRRLLQHVFNDSSDAIVVIDKNGRVLMYSHMAGETFGRTIDGDLDLPQEMMAAAKQAMATYRAESPSPSPMQELTFERPGRRQVFQYAVTPSCLDEVSRGRYGGARTVIATINAKDVTLLRRHERRITYMSQHDERTGALRRGAFLQLLQRRLEAGEPVAVFALNLHRFKTINATLGREVGDALLFQVVQRLGEPGRGLSPVLRLDGDSFAVFCTQPTTADQARDLAQWIIDRVGETYHLETASAQIGARIGYTLEDPASGLTAAAALTQAEEALDAARQFAGSRIELSDPAISRAKSRARAIEQAMWGAIERDEFYLLYQPQVRLSDGALIGAEALLRWQNPTLGPVFPDEFIAVAESNGFIVDLGRWVLNQATRDAMVLPPHVAVAVNVSAIQMQHGDLVGQVQNALRSSGLPASRLCLELTESVFMSPSGAMVETMRDIDLLGTSWALDDFGTGYSSLGYLSTIPLRKIKLDKRFTMGLGTDEAALAIVQSVSVLCQGTGVQLLCEGVESEDQVDILRREGCAEGQGFLFGRPQTLNELVDLADTKLPAPLGLVGRAS